MPPLIAPIVTLPLAPANRSVPVLLRPPIVLDPLPETPTDPPLIPPARLAVPPMLSVPVVTASVMDALPEKVVNPVLVRVVSEPLLRNLVVPVPLRLVAVTVPVAPLNVSVEALASAPKLPLPTVNNADPPVTLTELPP